MKENSRKIAKTSLPEANGKAAGVKKITLTHVLTCLAAPDKIRFNALIDRDISDILPYLNAVVKNAVYSHEGRSLTFIKSGRIITLYPQQVSGGKINDENDARAILLRLKNLINRTCDNRKNITPDYDRRHKLGPLEIYRFLPETNCKKCGANSCLAFAVMLTDEETNIMRCKPILAAEYGEKRKMLFRLLKNSGYSVPSVFVDTD